MNNELKKIVNEIINSEEYQKRKKYLHHENESVYDHSIKTTIKAYKISKLLHLDVKSVVIGTLLHDFYKNPWMNNNDSTKKFHGIYHAKDALKNAQKYFPHLMNPKVIDIIEKHMWPINPRPPKYIESWLVSFTDKYVSLNIFKNIRALPKYVGIRKKVRKYE